ncbi:Uncharacterized protein dnm_000210 [Desulfonema magnum]|uniref:Uncharacterized protein n=1 Tax=Desulfonema magnum TaxID=45655 RepID=A0A975GJV1_9BACT|nr:Uncharacterized protein dnm_000210 [Desulfonema magnum]
MKKYNYLQQNKIKLLYSMISKLKRYNSFTIKILSDTRVFYLFSLKIFS